MLILANGIPLVDWQLFLVVDISVLPVLKLRIQCAPPQYNVSIYSVKLRRRSKPEGNDWVVSSKDLEAPPNATEDTFIEYSYDSGFKPGVYKFTVVPNHQTCAEANKCESDSPSILIGK